MEHKTPPALPVKKAKKGFINKDLIRTITFSISSLCILICVTSCLLAIWDFAKEGTLWRTVATCVVITAGTMIFSAVNLAYGKED